MTQNPSKLLSIFTKRERALQIKKTFRLFRNWTCASLSVAISVEEDAMIINGRGAIHKY